MTEPLRVLSLFAGIGGFDLGLERTGGFKTVAFCEIEPFAVRVLNKHWPEVPVYGDVRELTGDKLRADGVVPNVIVGGFPCQDLSEAGQRAGLNGERSGLWSEFARLIGEIRPAFAIVENVADLLSGERGAWFARVLRDLAALGYDAEWHCIPAASVGAPHLRDRVWVVSYPNEIGRGSGLGAQPYDKDTIQQERQPAQGKQQRRRGLGGLGALGATVSNSDGRRLHSSGTNGSDGGEISAEGLERFFHRSNSSEGALVYSDCKPMVGAAIARQERHPWAVEPPVGRVVDGLPRALVQPQLRALGNAVVPQIPELIGRAILAAIADRSATAPRRETGVARKGESGGASAIAQGQVT